MNPQFRDSATVASLCIKYCIKIVYKVWAENDGQLLAFMFYVILLIYTSIMKLYMKYKYWNSEFCRILIYTFAKA